MLQEDLLGCLIKARHKEVIKSRLIRLKHVRIFHFFAVKHDGETVFDSDCFSI